MVDPVLVIELMITVSFLVSVRCRYHYHNHK